MRFSEDQIASIEQALKNKGANKPCVVCGSVNLVIVDKLIILVKSTSGAFPVIATACGNCGKTEYFAANTLIPGLLPDTSPV